MRGMTLHTAAVIAIMPVAIILSSIFFNVLYEPAYRDHFLGYPDSMEEKSGTIVGYVTWTEDELPEGLIEREVRHLEDVRGLFGVAALILISSLIFIIVETVRLKKRGKITRALIYGSLVSMMSLAFLAFASINFQEFFWSFHAIFFSPGSWVFSNQDLLIQLYPSTFFEGMFISIVIDAAAISALVLNTTLLLRNNRKINFLLQ